MIGQHPDRLQLGVVEQVGFVDHDDGGAAAFDLLDRERVNGLRDQGGVVGQRPVPEGGDDLVVDAADPDRRVGQVDDGVPGRVEGGEGGADGDGFPSTDLAGDHPDAVLGDAPADPGDGLAVGGVAMQHPGGEVASERGAGEPEESLQPIDHDATSPGATARSVTARSVTARSVTARSVTARSVTARSVTARSVSRSSCPGS